MRTGPILAAAILVAGCGNPQRPAPRDRTLAAAADAGPRASHRSLPLVPGPRSARLDEGTFDVSGATPVFASDLPDAVAIGKQLARWLGLKEDVVRAIPQAVAQGREEEAGIVLHLTPSARPRDAAVESPSGVEEEGFTLEVTPRRAIVRAGSRAGLFYGAQTLAQLGGARRVGDRAREEGAPPHTTFPCVAIQDGPRVPFRAMHLDVARHFFAKEVVERYVDLLAFYRFNVFHLHLTDDQGFRFEVKRHPELTAIGGKDGSFSQADAAEIVEYAKGRSITVIPEIEMPGHARAILAAHPELSCTGKPQAVPRTWGIFDDVLCAGNDASYALVGDVLREVAAVFPSRMIHVGGDEVPTTRWAGCPKCRARAAADRVAIKDLETVFMNRVATILGGLGRRMVVWDEALVSDRASRFPLPRDAIVVAWQSKERGQEALRLGHDVVMAPNEQVYLNFFQSRVKGEPANQGFLPWPVVRAFDPVPGGLDPTGRAHLLGGEGTLWSEYVERPDQIDGMVMPRMAALAEALWSGTSSSSTDGAKGEADFIARWNGQLPALDASKVAYFIEPPTGIRPRHVFLETSTVALATPVLFPAGIVRWTRDGSEPTAGSPAFDAPVTLQDSTEIAAAVFLPNGRRSFVARSTFAKERPRPAREVAKPHQGALYTYVEGPFHRLPDFGKLAPVRRGEIPRIGLGELEQALAGKMRKESFAALFEGFVHVATDGVYRFVARADDGVRVEVAREIVVTDDGEHEPREADGEIALGAGFHELRVSYFQGAEGKELGLKVEGPGRPLAPVETVVEGPK